MDVFLSIYFNHLNLYGYRRRLFKFLQKLKIPILMVILLPSGDRWKHYRLIKILLNVILLNVNLKD